jgi:hypothetical protein
MKPEIKCHIKKKLPNLLITLFNYHNVDILCEKCKCSHEELLKWVSGEMFPDSSQLKSMCDSFCFTYSTLKTWRLNETN